LFAALVWCGCLLGVVIAIGSTHATTRQHTAEDIRASTVATHAAQQEEEHQEHQQDHDATASTLAATSSIVCTASRAALHQEKLKQELKQIKATTAGAESSESTAARLTATIHYITAFATSI
jgi:hypothetical protein